MQISPTFARYVRFVDFVQNKFSFWLPFTSLHLRQFTFIHFSGIAGRDPIRGMDAAPAQVSFLCRRLSIFAASAPFLDFYGFVGALFYWC
jgi:hypothetical protein